MLRLWQVSQQTFWTFLDLASEIWKKRERGASSRGVFSRRGLRAGDECWRNAPGMSDGAFLEAASSTRADVAPGGNHRIIIPTTAYLFLSNTNTEKNIPTHTHIPVEHSPLHDRQRGESLRGNLTPSCGGVVTSNLYRWFYLLFMRIYVCEF